MLCLRTADLQTAKKCPPRAWASRAEARAAAAGSHLIGSCHGPSATRERATTTTSIMLYRSLKKGLPARRVRSGSEPRNGHNDGDEGVTVQARRHQGRRLVSTARLSTRDFCRTWVQRRHQPVTIGTCRQGNFRRGFSGGSAHKDGRQPIMYLNQLASALMTSSAEKQHKKKRSKESNTSPTLVGRWFSSRSIPLSCASAIVRAKF